MGAGTALLEFAARARVEELPPPAVEVARLALLDWWGVTVAGATEPVSRRLGAVVREGTGPVSVLGTTRRASPVTAALLNGTAAHALDYDDTHLDLPGHLTAPIVPGLLALAESRHLGGRPLLAAFAVGAEVMCRLGRAFGRDHYRLGWHATTTLGRLGGAIAAGRLAGLDARLLDQAFGLAAAQLGGIQESFGTMAKPFQVGRAASDALLAALLAEAGVTGGSGLLGRDDWTRRLSSAWAPAALEDGLGHRWHFTEVLFKRYPCCFATHAAIRALLSFQPAPDPAAIQAVDLEICPTTLQVANQVAPRTGLGGKFSITHCAAVALRRGWVAEADFTDEAVADRGLRALAGRVRLHATSALDETRARVVVHLADGGARVSSADLRAGAELTGLRRDLVRKLHDLLEARLGPERATEIEAGLARIDELDDVGALARLSAPPPRPRRAAAVGPPRSGRSRAGSRTRGAATRGATKGAGRATRTVR